MLRRGKFLGSIAFFRRRFVARVGRKFLTILRPNISRSRFICAFDCLSANATDGNVGGYTLPILADDLQRATAVKKALRVKAALAGMLDEMQ